MSYFRLSAVLVAAILVLSACVSENGAPSASPDASGTLVPASPTSGASPSGSTSPDPSASAEPPTGVPQMTDPELGAAIAADGLDQPTGLAFMSAGDYLVIEKASGNVKRVQAGAVEAEPVLDLAVNFFDERGLLGIELHPDFASNGFVYLYWTARDDSNAPQSLLGEDSDEPTDVPELGNRVDRFTWDGSALTWDREIARLRSNTLETDTSDRIRGNHDAGPMEFGPDGKLYVQNGDQNLRGQLQNIGDGAAPDDANLTGMILRLNDDGSVPDDNPFFAQGAEIGGEVGENIQAIWAYGIRNSFGLRFHPGTGELWQTENGDDSWDEINRFTAGANSGWIQLMGPPERFDEYRRLETESEDGLDNPDYPPDQLAATADEALDRLFVLDGSAYSAPVFSWLYPPAVTALEFVTGELGSSSDNSIFVGTVLTDALLRYPLADDGSGLAFDDGLADNVDDNTSKGDIGESADYVVGTGFGVITDIVLGPDGLLYVSSISSGAVYVVGPPDALPAPSASAGPGASPSGSGSAEQVLIQTDTGTANEFVPTTAEVATGTLVSMTFENISTAPHNLTFGPPINEATATVVQAGQSETIEFTAPEPGDYTFVCTLHPGMEGTLTVTR